MDPKYTAHLHKMDQLLMAIGGSGNDSSDALGRTVGLAVAELIQTVSDLAADLDALDRRLKAVERPN